MTDTELRVQHAIDRLSGLSVADYLARWQSLHLQFRVAVRDNDRRGMFDAILSAQAARQSAHDADPTHADPAWQSKAIPSFGGDISQAELHEPLMDFYAKQLEKLS